MRRGTVNCMDEDATWNVAHLVVGNLPEGGLAACGKVLDVGMLPKFHADRGGPDGMGECTCAPAEEWPRCPDCIRAQEESAARKAARDAAQVKL